MAWAGDSGKQPSSKGGQLSQEQSVLIDPKGCAVGDQARPQPRRNPGGEGLAPAGASKEEDFGSPIFDQPDEGLALPFIGVGAGILNNIDSIREQGQLLGQGTMGTCQHGPQGSTKTLG